MKKIVFLSLSIFSLTFIFACQKKTTLQELSWDAGQPAKSLAPLEKLETKSSSQGVFYKNEKIEFFSQKKSNIDVINSFIKKTSAGSDLKSVRANYVPESVLEKNFFSLNKVSFSETAKNTAIEIVKKLNLSRVKSYSTQQELQLINLDHVKKVLSVHYELTDGTLWKSVHDESGALLSNARLGSLFDAPVETKMSVYELGPKLSPLIEVRFLNLDAKPTVSNKTVFVDSESPLKVTDVSASLKFDPKDERFDQTQAFYYLDAVQTWMKNNLYVRFPEKLEAVVNVGYPEKTNTAFYYQGKIRLGHGDDQTYSLIASDASIVYHESFHALIDGVAHLPYEGEGGSLNEAFADFFTCMALKRPYLGESAYLPGPFKRTLLLTRNLSEKKGGLYFDSQIVSSLLWEVKDSLSDEKGLLLAIETLIKLTPVSDFADFNTQFLTVVNSKLSATDQIVVKNILKSRGFKYE